MAHGERAGRVMAGLTPSRVLVVASLFVIAYFGVSIAGNAVTRYDHTLEQRQLRRDIAALEARRQRLDALRAYMESDEFVERAARQQGMVRPGDVPFIVSAPETGAPADLPPGSPWWERYFAPQRP